MPGKRHEPRTVGVLYEVGLEKKKNKWSKWDEFKYAREDVGDHGSETAFYKDAKKQVKKDLAVLQKKYPDADVVRTQPNGNVRNSNGWTLI